MAARTQDRWLRQGSRLRPLKRPKVRSKTRDSRREARARQSLLRAGAIGSIESPKEAVKALASMPRHTREGVKSKPENLALDPAKARNVKKLVDRPGYRFRVGGWRVISTLDSGRMGVLVRGIGARGDP